MKRKKLKSKIKNKQTKAFLSSPLFLVLFLCAIHPSFSQVKDSLPQFSYKGYMKSYLLDSKDVVLSPFTINKRSVISYSVFGVGLASCFYFDEKIQKWSQSNISQTSRWISDNIFEPTGSGLYPAIFVGGLYGYGLLSKDNKIKKTSMNALKATIISGLIVKACKYSFRRERPYENNGSWQWYQSTNDRSFISGHTTLIFSIASTFAFEYSEHIWIPILSYTLATGVGLSRIHDNKHWASDVFAGAFIGYGTAWIIYKQKNWIYILPQLNDDGLSALFIINI